MRKKIVCSGLLCLVFAASALAKPTDFRAEIDRGQVALGQAVQLNLIFEGEQNVPAPELPPLEDFQTKYLGPSSQFSVINGKTSLSVTHRYLLFPQKKGTFEIGPFSVQYEGQTYTARALTIEVIDFPARNPSSTDSSQEERPSLENRIFLNMEAGKTEAYLHELVPVTIRLYSDRLPVRVEKLPEITGQAGFSVLEFGPPRQYKEDREGVTFDVLEFKTHVFAARTGELSLGPAQMTPILVLRKSPRHPSPDNDQFAEDFFSVLFGGWEEPYPVNLKSNPLVLLVKPLPEQNRPEGFGGAVGRFNLQASAEPAKVKEGDPVTLSMAVRGDGNFNTVQAPRLQDTEGFKVYDPRVVRSAEREKIFEQVILPKTTQVRQTPAPVFSFFDPGAGAYQTLSVGPFPLEVERQEGLAPGPPTAFVPQGSDENRREQDIVFIKEAGPCERFSPLYARISFWILQMIPLVALSCVYFYKKKSERLRLDAGFARRIAAPRKARKGLAAAGQFLETAQAREFYEIAQKTLREYLGDRFHAPSGGLTGQTAGRFLADRNVPEDIRRATVHIFEECDSRFAGTSPDISRMKLVLKNLTDVIAALENLERRDSKKNGFRLRFLMALAWAFCLPAFAGCPDFDSANNLYRQGKFAEALSSYEQLILQGYGSGPLYFNAGNTYYKTGQLGRALLNYERARKFMPRDADLETNMDVVRSKLSGKEAVGRKTFLLSASLLLFGRWTISEYVWFLSGLYFLLCAGLFLLILRPEFKKTALFLMAGVLLVSGLAAVSLRQKISLQNTEAVVLDKQTLARFEPMESSAVNFDLAEGAKILAVETRQGWTKVRRPDGKTGWVRQESVERI
ncbi:MAG: BatD family protein [Candidatus Omnitrophota bacterium]